MSRFAQLKRNAHARGICSRLAGDMLTRSDGWSEEEMTGDSLVLQHLVEEGNSDSESKDLISLGEYCRLFIFFRGRGPADDDEEPWWQGAILRLVCLYVRPKRLRYVRPKRLRNASSVRYTKVAAHFDLSPGLTLKLMTFLRHQSEDGVMVLRFTGSLEDLTHCLGRVEREIWANKDGRLDAWRQLYVLACVKTWFEDFWISREHAVELGELRRRFIPFG